MLQAVDLVRLFLEREKTSIFDIANLYRYENLIQSYTWICHTTLILFLVAH